MVVVVVVMTVIDRGTLIEDVAVGVSALVQIEELAVVIGNLLCCILPLLLPV